jgi:hypothetical protein
VYFFTLRNYLKSHSERSEESGWNSDYGLIMQFTARSFA